MTRNLVQIARAGRVAALGSMRARRRAGFTTRRPFLPLLQEPEALAEPLFAKYERMHRAA